MSVQQTNEINTKLQNENENKNIDPIEQIDQLHEYFINKKLDENSTIFEDVNDFFLKEDPIFYFAVNKKFKKSNKKIISKNNQLYKEYIKAVENNKIKNKKVITII